MQWFDGELPPVYLHRAPIDFRKSINGLSLVVEHQMLLSPLSSALFVFCNRRRDKLKVLHWDKTGFVLWYKRLERERFAWPRTDELVVSVTPEQLRWLLRGIDVWRLRSHRPLEFAQVS